MGLFDKLKSLVSDDKKDTGTIEIIAPLSGEIVNIEDVPDVVFAEKIVGDGIAIKPTGNKMVAPVDGTIGKIFETNHAFSIESDSGVELFVHFGIDTVELKGEGFKRIAEEGQRVEAVVYGAAVTAQADLERNCHQTGAVHVGFFDPAACQPQGCCAFPPCLGDNRNARVPAVSATGRSQE